MVQVEDLKVPQVCATGQRLRSPGPQIVPCQVELLQATQTLPGEQGFRALANADPGRIKWIEATQPITDVTEQIWIAIKSLL